MLAPKLEGFYTLKKYCAKSGQLKQELGPVYNKITNIGLNNYPDSGLYNVIAYVGTGTTPSQITDISMGNQIAHAPTVLTTKSSSNVVPYWKQDTLVYRFDPGVVVGNITEVGVGWSNTSLNALWSRELIVDSEGNPVALTILADEFLEVSYSLRLYPSTEDFTSSVTIGSTVYPFTGRTAYINSSSVALADFNLRNRSFVSIVNCFSGPCVLGPVTAGITGATDQGGGGVAVPKDYVPNTYVRDSEQAFGLTQANFTGGIKAMELSAGTVSPYSAGMHQRWQIVFDTPIPKTADNGLNLTLRMGWGRYTGPITP